MTSSRNKEEFHQFSSPLPIPCFVPCFINRCQEHLEQSKCKSNTEWYPLLQTLPKGLICFSKLVLSMWHGLDGFSPYSAAPPPPPLQLWKLDIWGRGIARFMSSLCLLPDDCLLPVPCFHPVHTCVLVTSSSGDTSHIGLRTTHMALL